MKRFPALGLSRLILGLLCAVTGPGSRAAGDVALDFSLAAQADDWLRHPVYGDPSFDAFERVPGNPIHRGTPPYEWPVNGFFFEDPRSQNWYVFVGEYGKGYLKPPSRCLLYRSANRGGSWANLGPVLQGDTNLFDRGGHTPDVSVVYSDRRYHMVYDWGEADFNAEGGLAYAWAERPEGPWHRAPEPITRNSTLPKLLGRYQRTYAATLLKRDDDWLILGMMDRAPHSWALFAMTSPKPEGPYSERRLVCHVEDDRFHPPLMEFYPAFVHEGFVYAPATSVALNRNFNALFRAPLERAHDPSAWSLTQHGSLWHAEPVEAEHYGLWGQTFSGFVHSDGLLTAMFPSRDATGAGTIHLARRKWSRPLRPRGFVLTGHAGPSFTLLRKAFPAFSLDADLEIRGTVRLLIDCSAPLGPSAASSDSSLHPLMNSLQLFLQLAPSGWSLVRNDRQGASTVVASGELNERPARNVKVDRDKDRLLIRIDDRDVWTGPMPQEQGSRTPGLIGFRTDASSRVAAEKFLIRGRAQPATITYLHTEALLGAGASPEEWESSAKPDFRYGTGSLSRTPASRAKWNVIGASLRLWSPRGPDLGSMDVRLDGKLAAIVNLHSETPLASSVVWESTGVQPTMHTLVLTPKSGTIALDCLEVDSEVGRRAAGKHQE